MTERQGCSNDHRGPGKKLTLDHCWKRLVKIWSNDLGCLNIYQPAHQQVKIKARSMWRQTLTACSQQKVELSRKICQNARELQLMKSLFCHTGIAKSSYSKPNQCFWKSSVPWWGFLSVFVHPTPAGNRLYFVSHNENKMGLFQRGLPSRPTNFWFPWDEQTWFLGLNPSFLASFSVADRQVLFECCCSPP